MRGFLLVLFLTITAICFAQQDSVVPKFRRIFGCSCCSDTIRHPSDKNSFFILTEAKTQITAWRAGKKRWTRSILMFGDRNVWVTCMELRIIEKKQVLRVHINDREYVDLNVKNGKTVSTRDTCHPDH
ncbi:MAG: hypothetical protein K0S33_3082 [Bacteroidetes bacterium]|jgi:hypothetical protein|nr:hypothetical protein [Bacteroidota bacterium]